jgi:hypothetical protein
MAEPESQSAASSHQDPPVTAHAAGGSEELLRGLQGLLGSMVGSLAGLTALCYGAGYFLFHAHLNMLGLGEVIDFPQDKMLVEGGRFFLYSIGQLITDGILLGGLFAFLLATWTILKEIPVFSRPMARGSSRLNDVRLWFANRHPRLGDALMLLVFVALLAVHIQTFFYPISSLQQLSSILYDAPELIPRTCEQIGASGAPFNMIVAAMVKNTNCTRYLKPEFDSILDQYLLVVLLLFFAFSYTARRSGVLARRLPRMLVGAYGVIFTLMLPIAFGVLVREPFYPTVEVSLTGGQKIVATLLERTDTRVLLWEDDVRRVVWYSSAKVDSVQVTGEKNIFEKSRK